jgi:hypothetical protein
MAELLDHDPLSSGRFSCQSPDAAMLRAEWSKFGAGGRRAQRCVPFLVPYVGDDRRYGRALRITRSSSPFGWQMMPELKVPLSPLRKRMLSRCDASSAASGATFLVRP